MPPRIALWGATARRDLPQDFRDGARNCGAPQDERASPVEGHALLLEFGLKDLPATTEGRAMIFMLSDFTIFFSF